MPNVQFTINNISSNTVTYQGQSITASNSYTPSAALQSDFASDPGVIADLLSSSISITIGNNTWSGLIALEVLKAIQILSSTGNAAHGATDSGNPVKIGGVYRTTPPSLSNNQRSDLQMNTEGRVKVETVFSSSISTVPGIVKLAYDDMNASNGGVARDTAITTSYTTVYNRSGSGLLFGFCISFEGNIFGADEFIVKFTVDSLVVAEISTLDIGTNSIYNMGAGGDAALLGWQTDSNNVLFKPPGHAGIKYGSSIKIEIKKASGANKKFRAGIVSLTKE